jgi:hypothetical protein
LFGDRWMHLAAAFHWRALPWAVVAALPTVIALLVLSTHKWA